MVVVLGRGLYWLKGTCGSHKITLNIPSPGNYLIGHEESNKDLLLDWLDDNFVPRPIPFSVLRFALTIVHRCGRAMKNGEGWVLLGIIHHVHDVWWT